MKKALYSLGLLLAVAGTAKAQTTTFGVKAGASLSSVSGDNTENVKSIIGFVGGVAANFGFSDLLSLQPELLYSMKGSKFESAGLKAEGRTSYLDIPVLLKANADGPFFELGPQVGFLLSQKTTKESNGRTTTSTDTEGTRQVDFGYVVGLGYQLESGLGIGLRYNGGIPDLSDPSEPGQKQRNSVFQLQLGYMFGGK
ncbi:porin family protein [Hymenobacter saemangeumensis]|uniref:Porin family protein n=1 Tax=Hymenobacter saemangeumensis TaxID=1084522 RepID=A0ABP8IPY4_9BACT